MEQVLQNLLRRVTAGEESIIDIAREAGVGDAPGKLTLALSQRLLNPEAPVLPTRMPSPPRKHAFSGPEGFAAYLTTYGTSSTVVLADPDSRTIYAILDEKATTGFEILTMKPVDHPLLIPWETATKRGSVPIREFVAFALANRRILTGYSIGGKWTADPLGKDTLMNLSQIKVAKNIIAQSGQGRQSINGIMIETEINGKLATAGIDIPDSLTILCPVYAGTSPIEMNIDMVVDSDKDHQVTARITCADLALTRIEAFEEMLAAIRGSDIAAGVVVGLGKPDHGVWDYAKTLTTK